MLGRDDLDQRFHDAAAFAQLWVEVKMRHMHRMAVAMNVIRGTAAVTGENIPLRTAWRVAGELLQLRTEFPLFWST